MRKIWAIILFFLSCFLPQFYRLFNTKPARILHPFFLKKDITISKAWYIKDICEALSFSFLMLTICFILKAVERHLEEVDWRGSNKMLAFTKTWHRIFYVVFITSIFDLAHYLISFKQTEWFFLILNGFFLFLTAYYIYRLYHPKRK